MLTLAQLKLQMTKSTFETWLNDTQLIAYAENCFTIQVTNQFAQAWLNLRLRPVIKRALQTMIGQPADIAFVVKPT